MDTIQVQRLMTMHHQELAVAAVVVKALLDKVKGVTGMGWS